jgi:polyisoprenoid-binding protein YceI
MTPRLRVCLCTLLAAMIAQDGSLVCAQPPGSAKELKADVKTSRVYILVDKVRLGHAHGVEGNLKSGQLKLDAKSDAGQFVFDMATFAADTEKARKHVGLEGETDVETQEKVNENLRGPKVLDVKEFPTATFDIDSSLATGKQSADKHPLYELKGRFTLHGTTLPLTIVAEVRPAEKSTRLSGKFKVLQTDYGIKPYSAALGAVAVADQLTIWGEIDLKP